MISMPTKEDFYFNSDKDNRMDVDYARKKFLGKNYTYVNKYFKKYSVYAFLENISYIGPKAFVYYVLPVFSYLKKESTQWDDEHYWDINNMVMDDEALSAFSVLPELLREKIDKYPLETKKIIKDISEFVNWAIDNYDNFEQEIFLYSDLKEQYIKLKIKVDRLL